MSAGDPERSGLRPPGTSDRRAPGHGRRAEFAAALRDLAQAVAAHEVEPICTAYLELRRAGRGLRPEQILDAASRVNGQSGSDLIVSAFAHRRCFMCEDGTVPCGTCEGTGVVSGRPCPSCDGQGVDVCSFCMGLGWTDAEDVPMEVRRQVSRRRADSLTRDADRLSELPLTEALASARKADARQRRKLTPWLLRLQARLDKAAGESNGNGFAATCRALCDRTEKILEALRPARPEPAAKEDSQSPAD